MSKKTQLMVTVYCCFFSISLFSGQTTRVLSQINLNNQNVQVYFNDGDTFKILEGKNKNASVRVAGFNSLETYGPVHSWMNNTAEYLFDVANEATVVAQQGGWNCVLEKGRDTYGRLLAICDDLAFSLISKGLAHAYSIDDKPAKSSYLTRQMQAQRNNLGMWQGGTPEYVVTSLHSADEGAKNTYNRLISAKDGHTKRWKHDDSYATCENVCFEEDDTCMIYVPYGNRYGNRAECLITRKH